VCSSTRSGFAARIARLISQGTKRSASPWISRIGTCALRTASAAPGAFRSKPPNSRAATGAQTLARNAGYPRLLITLRRISRGEVNGQSAITPRTFGGSGPPAAVSTVAAPIEMPTSRIGVSAPKRPSAQSIQRRRSRLSLMPKVIVCPSLPHWARCSIISRLCPSRRMICAPPLKSRAGVPRQPWQQMFSGAPSALW